MHKKAEWDNNYKRIVTRFAQTPIIIPEESLRSLLDANSVKKDSRAFFEAECFYDDGSSFSQKAVWKQDASYRGEAFDCCFCPEGGAPQDIVALRFDPRHLGFCTLSNLLMRVVSEDGSSQDYSIDDVTSNGCRIGGKLVYLKSDPQVILRFAAPMRVKQLLVRFDVVSTVTDEDIDVAMPLLQPKKRGFCYRALRKVYRTLKKIFGKA